MAEQATGYVMGHRDQRRTLASLGIRHLTDVPTGAHVACD
jgi:hypothetical protein